MYKKSVFILLLFTISIISCKSKKEATCPSYDTETVEEKMAKKNKRAKYRVVILKDGEKINAKKKRRKSKTKLFKKKMY